MTCSKTHVPGTPAEALTLQQLTARTGEPEKRLRELREAGLIALEGGDQFQPQDIARVRLVHDMLHYGHSLEEIAQAFRRPDSLFSHFLALMQDQLSRPTYPLSEGAEMTGLSLDQARRIMDASGVHEPGETVDDRDLESLRSAKVALDAGFPEEGLLQILRVYADAMAKAAEVGARVSHFYMHQPTSRLNLSPEEVMDRLETTFGQIEPLIQPALLYFYDKGQTKALWDDMLMHLEEEAGLTEKTDTPGQIRQAIMFVDLASFTPLAEAMGDLRAVQVVERFGEMVRLAVRRCHGRVVKQIGDAFMIVFPECYSAVSCALEVEERCHNEPQFPAASAGLHWGPVIYREGDYLGSNVNIASRLATEAGRHQVLVTEEVRRRAKELEGVEFIRLGRRRLKGLAAEVEVFEARAAHDDEGQRVIDPVCPMELGQGEIAARLTQDGIEHPFCSDDCLRKFVATPEKYLA